MPSKFPSYPCCPRQPLYPPRPPDVPMVTIGEFYAYQLIVIGAGSYAAIALGSILPAIGAPLGVGLWLFGGQQWQRHVEFKRFGREYYEFSRQQQWLRIVQVREEESGREILS